jgi:hypothetical protein
MKFQPNVAELVVQQSVDILVKYPIDPQVAQMHNLMQRHKLAVKLHFKTLRV